MGKTGSRSKPTVDEAIDGRAGQGRAAPRWRHFLYHVL